MLPLLPPFDLSPPTRSPLDPFGLGLPSIDSYSLSIGIVAELYFGFLLNIAWSVLLDVKPSLFITLHFQFMDVPRRGRGMHDQFPLNKYHVSISESMR